MWHGGEGSNILTKAEGEKKKSFYPVGQVKRKLKLRRQGAAK